jgi:excinuclease ABC subunit C
MVSYQNLVKNNYLDVPYDVREEQRTVGAMQEIADWLSLPHLVRAEAYDISNTSGIESVGSMVVFENG